MALTATQQSWVLSNVERRIVTVEFPAFEELAAVYIANEGWMPLIGPLYLGRILKPWTLSRSVGGQIVGGGRTVIGLGDIEAANADGELGWMEQDWHNRPVVIRWGDIDWLDIDDHIVIHNGFVDSLENTGLSIAIKLADDRQAFNVMWPRARYSANTVIDSNGVTDGLGEIKPMAHGNVINADTVLLQTAALFYGVNATLKENHFVFSEEVSDTDYWVNSGCTLTIDTEIGPNGLPAYKMESTATNSFLLQEITSFGTTERTVSQWVKLINASDTITVIPYSGDVGSGVLLTDEWQRISYTSTHSSAFHGLASSGENTEVWLVSGFQIELGDTIKDYARTAAYPITIPDIVKVRDNGTELTEGATNDWTEAFPGIVQIDNVVGKITADTEAGGGLAEDVFVRLLNDVGVINFDPASTLLFPDVEVSIWSGNERPHYEYVDACVNAVGCVWYPDRDGTIFAGLLDIPQTPDFEFDQRDILGQIQSDLITLPLDSISIGIKQSWAGQDIDSLATALDPDEKKLLSQTEIFVVASDDADLETDEASPDELETISTLMRVQSEGRTTGRTWQQMLSVKRELHKARLLRGAGLIDLASTIRLAHDDVDSFAGLQDENGEYIVDENFFRIERGKDMVVLSLEETFPFGSVDVEGWA